MSKTSTEWSELFGLRIALSNLKTSNNSQSPISKTEDVVVNWIELRIKQLENRGKK
jgi:hypothetical protein